MPETNLDTELYGLIWIAVVLALPLLVVFVAVFSNEFSQALRYLNNEIRRSEGIERKFWIRQRRRLWLSLIPFIKY